MNTVYLRNGSAFMPKAKADLNVQNQLPAGNYTVKKDPHGNFFLDEIGSFTRPAKIYGDTLKQSRRIFSTFLDRAASTGVLLSGEKGSGKTMLAKELSMTAAEQGIPTIVINQPWVGDDFNQLIQSIEQPCVIMFDEFEKVYDRNEQNQILTLLDGVFPSKKLFLLTCNDPWRIDEHMRNRPGRIFYFLEFEGLSAEFILEYCNDNLKRKEYGEKIVDISGLFKHFNFDMLKALVEEMNRYDESPQEAVKMLNIRPQNETSSSQFAIELRKGTNVIELQDSTWNGNPLSDDIQITYKDDSDEWDYVNFENTDIVSVRGREGMFMFENREGYRLVLRRVKEKSFNYMAF